MIRWLTLVFLFAIIACGKPSQGKLGKDAPATPDLRKEKPPNPPRVEMDEAAQIASLIDPAKLATLRERGVNSRIQKIMAILATAKTAGKNPEEITEEAVRKIGWGGTPKGTMTAAAILRNLSIAERLGATTDEDIAAMRKGNAAKVRRGPYAGDILSVDHIIPRSVSPLLDNVIANLELLPLKLNQSKGNKIGDRQRDLARKLHAAGLLADPKLPEQP